MSVLVVGSTGLDCIETPFGKCSNVLGGSAFYASIASSFFAKTALLGIVGDDFPDKHIKLLKGKKIDLSGLTIVKNGKTFRWSGKYHNDLNTRDTLDLQLNTFLQFSPQLLTEAKKSKFVFLANIDPDLHLDVLKQLDKTSFVLADTMDHWIKEKMPSLKKLLKLIDAFVVNDSEAKFITGENNLFICAQKLSKMGPKIIIIKKGEHGAILYKNGEIFIAPAYPLECLKDPTGAGDTFAGALIGYLASQKNLSWNNLKKAVVYGSITASYNCEAFSVDRLKDISRKDIDKRYAKLKKIVDF